MACVALTHGCARSVREHLSGERLREGEEEEEVPEPDLELELVLPEPEEDELEPELDERELELMTSLQAEDQSSVVQSGEKTCQTQALRSDAQLMAQLPRLCSFSSKNCGVGTGLVWGSKAGTT